MALFEKHKSRYLKENLVEAYNLLIEELQSLGYKLDFSIESLKEIDRFLDENIEDDKIKPDGFLSQDLSQRTFTIGSYVGEVIRRKCDGEWITDDKDPQGETYMEVKLSNGDSILPVVRVIKRIKNSAQYGIYEFGISCG